jgi:hypothetical protein
VHLHEVADPEAGGLGDELRVPLERVAEGRHVDRSLDRHALDELPRAEVGHRIHDLLGGEVLGEADHARGEDRALRSARDARPEPAAAQLRSDQPDEQGEAEPVDRAHVRAEGPCAVALAERQDRRRVGELLRVVGEVVLARRHDDVAELADHTARQRLQLHVERQHPQ